ncbi:MAG: cytochrome c maturation protein CcmE [Acidimicrobiales bacterium]|jgi:cytochrome c-type biogenesis protein CcmE
MTSTSTTTSSGTPKASGTTSVDGANHAAATNAESNPPKVQPKRRSKLRKRKLRLAIAGLILIGAFVFLLIEGITNSLNYFLTVNQAVAQRQQLGDTTFRLEGLVVPGTVHPTTEGVNFTVESSGVREAVVETGQPPQLFQPDIPVVLVGHFSGAFFSSDQILVDHTSQYIAKYPNRVKAPNGTTR